MKTLSKDYALSRIPGYDKHYIILGNGTVFGNRRVNNGRGIRLLSTQITNSGYELIHLIGLGGKRKAHTIHRLIALTFIPNPDNKKCVNHKDGNKLNNRVTNLEWVSAKENQNHAFTTGLISHKGENNSLSKLKNSDIPIIRERISGGELLKNIAKDYSVHYSVISGIKHNKIWTHI